MRWLFGRQILGAIGDLSQFSDKNQMKAKNLPMTESICHSTGSMEILLF